MLDREAHWPPRELGLERYVGPDPGAGTHDVAFDAQQVSHRPACGHIFHRRQPHLARKTLRVVQRHCARAARQRPEVGGADDDAVGTQLGECGLPLDRTR